jgi:OOP family OmpA-OmpF porin
VLSRERARAVRNSLIELGVDAGRIEARGYGETRPVADNTTPAGRARNRRVVFTVLEE